MRCKVTGSGVVMLPGRTSVRATTPTVPSDAAAWPADVQICRTKEATEVLPLVPVTATTDFGCGA